MKDRAEEPKAQAGGFDGERDVPAKIGEMPDEDRTLAKSIHELVRDVAPDVVARTWYGMPAYATPGKNGNVVCFFQSAAKMGTRYSSVGSATPPPWTRERCGRRRTRCCDGTPPTRRSCAHSSRGPPADARHRTRAGSPFYDLP